MRKNRKDSVYAKTFRKGVKSSLIPLLFLSFCVFAFSTGQSLERLRDADYSILVKDDQLITYMLEDLSRSMENLARDPTAIDFAMHPSQTDTERNAALCAVLDNLTDSYPYVDVSYLVSSHAGLSLTSMGHVLSGTPDWFADYLEDCQPFHTGVDFQMQALSGGTDESLLLSIGLPAYSADPVAAAILRIDMGSFLKSAIAVQEEVGELSVRTPHSGWTFSDGGVEYAAYATDAGEAVEPGLAWAGTGLILHSVHTNRELGLEYRKVSPVLAWGNDPFPLVFPLVLSIFAACLIGLLLAYQSSRELYRPLEQLLSTLPPPAAETETNEYQRLADYYDELLQQREEVYEQVGAIKPLLVKKFLASLANEKGVHPDEIRYQMELLEIPFQPTYFRVLLLELTRYDKTAGTALKKQELKEQVQARIRAWSNPAVYSICAEIADRVILVVCNLQREEPEEAARRTLRAAAEELKTELEDAYPLRLTVGVGRACRLEELSASCESAKTALSYKLYRGEGSLIDAEEIDAASKQAYYYDAGKTEKLLNSIRTGDEKNARCLLHEIFAGISDAEKYLPKQVWAILQNLTDALGDLLLSSRLADETDAAERLRSELTQKNTLPDIEAWMTGICCQAAAAIKAASSGRAQQNARQIKDYIDRNLTKDLSLSLISDYINYSPAYVSKIFRQYYGVSCTDYLNSRRIELSKELLLADPSRSVKEIGFQAGFNNMQSFFRIFKRYTGMTPLQYRETGSGEGEM